MPIQLNFAVGKFSALLALFELFGVVKAQAPFYTGELLLEPGLDNGKCLTASHNGDGAHVTLQPCTGAPGQKWVFAEGQVRVFGNKCLDVPSGVSADGTPLHIWTCMNGNPNQQWYYTWDYRLAWADHARCLDVPAGNTTDGTRAHIWQCLHGNANQVWNTGYHVSQLPQTSQEGQFGTNACGSESSQDSRCQTIWINSAEDFCVWGPPSPGTVGDTERQAVAYCTKSGRETRVIPDGTLWGVHFVKTPDYVQVTGVGDFTRINILAGDAGGEMDSHGADGKGNPIGGLVYGNSFGEGRQYHEWSNFMGSNQFCFRACVGPNAAKLCNHIYDIMGCAWNIPANYAPDQYEQCEGDNAQPMGIYGTSTWYQGVSPTPSPHPAPSSSNCQPLPTVGVTPARKRREILGIGRSIMVIETIPTPPPKLGNEYFL
ncbi:hypothetical protein AX16_007107 [Volvariella volvacea WC 439]|nr:hypothetical protein AX16_007107 [Volvariella volvacea WC 439]